MPDGMQGQPQQGGQATAADLLQSVGQGLQAVTEGLNASDQVPPEIKQQMSSILQAYTGVVQGLLGGGQPQGQGQDMPVSEQAPRGGMPV